MTGGRWTVLLLFVAACSGSRATPEPDAQFGHRYEDPAPDGRRVVTITPEQQGESYRYFPATVEEVVIRPAPMDASAPADTQQVEIEVLVKGGLPDMCMQLHSFTQERTANIIHATLTMRRSMTAMCPTAVRPYRFYVMLEGRYGTGSYTLRLNEAAFPFQVRAPIR